MKIPGSFYLMGSRYSVKIVPAKVWPFADDEVGVFDPLSKTISLRKQERSGLEHTYLHELTHAILHAMNRDKLYMDESFVDVSSGLLHQALLTAE